MPLPPNTGLSLLGYSRPGDTLQSKPKQAMLVRLSSETLDALESFSSQPQVQFEFGDNPGIHVGDAHFPMRHYKENNIHELFLRMSSATKKNAPLKLHANVIGKFAVERELADEIRDKIRESTQDAANQRNSRTTVFIETPPDIPSNTRKRKEPPSSMFRKPLRPSDKLKTPQLTATAPAPSKNAAVPSQTHLNPARKRMLQILAISEKTEEQLMKIFGSSDRTPPSRRELQDLLVQLAEPGSSPVLYRLRTEAFKEVRPYEWTNLTETDKRTIARAARIALQKAGIPESDPVWNNVRYRSPAATGSNVHQTISSTDHAKTSSSVDETSHPRKQEIEKRGVTSREAKEKKNKPKPDTKTQIMMKDESRRAAPRAIHHDEKPKLVSESRRPAESSVNGVGSTRSQPSHLSKLSKSQAADQSYSSSATNKAPGIRHADRDITFTNPGNKSKPTQDEKGIVLTSSSQKMRKIRQDDEISIADSDREKRRARGEKDARGMADGVRDDLSVSLSKRKTMDSGKDASHDTVLPSNPIKRRKAEYQPASSSTSSLDQKKDLATKGLPSIRKSYLEPRLSEKPALKNSPAPSSSLRSKKNDSPPPSKRHAASNTSEGLFPESSSTRPRTSSINGSQSNKSNTVNKSRRPPVYTSSEDDDASSKTRPPAKGSVPTAAPAPITTRTSHSRNNSTARPLPTDRASLRERYDQSYLEYISSLQRLLMQKGKIDTLLKNDLASTGTTDSEGDGEILDPEELAQLTTNHKRLQEELETIQQMFGRTSKGEVPHST